MDSFKYALSGEFAFQQDILHDIRIPSDWGLEMGMLEIYRNQSANKARQVDILFYDHKHQTMSFRMRVGGFENEYGYCGVDVP